MDRLEKAIFDIYGFDYEDMKEVMACLNKGMRVVVVRDNYERAVEDFPELKITIK